jgi:hypothetical protein
METTMSELVEKSDDQHRGHQDPYLKKMVKMVRDLQTTTMPCGCGRRATRTSTRTGRLRLFCAECAAVRA